MTLAGCSASRSRAVCLSAILSLTHSRTDRPGDFAILLTAGFVL